MGVSKPQVLSNTGPNPSVTSSWGQRNRSSKLSALGYEPLPIFSTVPGESHPLEPRCGHSRNLATPEDLHDRVKGL